MRVQRLEMWVRCDHGCVQHQHDFDEATNASVGLLVPDVGLGCAVRDRVVAAVLEHDPAHGAHFDGIAQGGAGAMALAAHDVLRDQPSLAEALPDALLLRRPVGSGQTGAAAVLIRAGAHHDSERLDRGIVVVVLVAQVDRTTPLASDEPVGALIEGEAPASEREHGGGTLANPATWRDHDEDAHAESLVHARLLLDDHRLVLILAVRPGPHRVARRVRRDQRRRARGVHAELRAFEAEDVRQPGDRDRDVVVGALVLVRTNVHLVPVAARVPHVMPDALAVQGVIVPASLVQSLVAHLEDPALRGRHRGGLGDGVAEELVVKADADVVVDEGAVHDVGFAEPDGIAVLEMIEVLIEA
mmetsp:Transcript_123408/g.308341  ORF Transcript_123408/g.308341 Transcript_123408/m.308341 type:complete len:358 (-) Transcript_123408:1137-2210(-)